MSKFYNSAAGKFITPQSKGWYIEYVTDGGFSYYQKVERKPYSEADAEVMLLLLLKKAIKFTKINWSYHKMVSLKSRK